MLKGIRRSLGNKIMAVVMTSLAVVMGLEIVFKVYLGNRETIKVIDTMARDLAVLTYTGIEYPMAIGDSKAVINVLTDFRDRMEGIEVFICNDRGKITWTTQLEIKPATFSDAQFSTRSITALTEALNTGATPTGTLIDRVGNNRSIVVIRPVANKKSCHLCHDPTKKILGAIVVRTNAEQHFIDAAASIQRTIFTSFFGIAGAIVMIYLMTWKFILRPVVNLTSAVRRVSEGDLDFEIHCDSQDEIGVLARSVNQMTGDLKSARDELNRWTDTLEDLVEERTDQLQRAQENAIRSEKMASLGRLAAIVAHEINNPLAGIRTYAKLLLKKSGAMATGADARTVEQLKTIESEAARCGEIVRNLLQFARPSPPMVSRHDLNNLISDSVRLVQHKVQLLNVELTLSLSPDPVETNCDGQKIKQGLVALLLNACEAVQPEEGRIEIVSGRAAAGDGVTFSIRDNGVGMDEETKAHMFEPFFTTKTKKEEDATGTNMGLGVSVVYEIIRAHHGEITVESDVGQGTAITVFLPDEREMVE